MTKTTSNNILAPIASVRSCPADIRNTQRSWIPDLILSILACLLLTSSTGCVSNVGRKAAAIDHRMKEEWVSDPFIAPYAEPDRYDEDTALSLARVCRLVWEEEKGMISAVSKSWNGSYLFADLPDTHSQYLLFGNSDFTILSFRATQTKAGDIWTVLKYKRWVTNDDAGDSIYADIPAGNAGFRESAADCFAGGLIDDILLFRAATGAEEAPLFLAGHSLGGGVALLARPKLEAAGVKTDALYVYGCPVSVSPYACVSADYQSTYGASTFFLRHEGDNVPRLRPWPETYSPPGLSWQLASDGTRSELPEYRTLNAVSSVAWSVPWLTGIIKSHNLEKSYLPALKAGVTQKAELKL